MICRWAVPLVLTAGAFLAFDGSPGNTLETIVLKADSSKVLPLPTFSAEIGPQCDSDGNLFFRTGYMAKYAVILKVAPSDGSTTLYRPTYGDEYFIAFHVTSSRRIAVLIGGRKDELYVFEFSESDPDAPTKTPLDVPAGLTALGVQAFLVLPNDHILLQGYFDKDAVKGGQGHSYLAEFGSSGKLLRLSLEDASGEILKSVADRAARTAVGQGQDGRLYLLNANKIIVLSPSGEVEREMKLDPPEPGDSPELLYMHKGQMVLGFVHSEKDRKVTKVLYTLVDPTTGKRLHVYEPDAELGSNLVCFSDDGLTFMKSEKGHVKLITAAVK